MSPSRIALPGACQKRLTKAPDHTCPLPSLPCSWTLNPCPGARGGRFPLPFPGALGESRQACPSRFRPVRGISLGREGERTHP